MAGANGGSVAFAVLADTSRAIASVKNLKNSIGGIGAAFGVVAGATAGIGKVLGPIVKTGSEFEESMSKVQAISGTTKEGLAELTTQARQLGKQTSFSAKEAADGMENMASAGFDAKQIMQAMPGVMALAAVSGRDVAKAADYISSTVRGFGGAASDAGHYADVFAQAAADTNAETNDMGQAMKYVAPAAHAMGIGVESSAAAIGLLADAGIKGSQAGTTLRAGLINLAKPSKDMAAGLQKMGVNAFDAQGKFVGMNSLLTQLQKGTKGMTQQQKENNVAAVFGKTAMSGWMALIDRGPKALAKETAALNNSNGAAAKMAKTMQDNFANAKEQMLGSLDDMKIGIYNSLQPALKHGAQFMADFYDGVTDVVDTKGFSSGLENIANSVFDTFKNLVNGIKPYMSKIFDGILEVMPHVISMLSALGSAFGSGNATAGVESFGALVDEIDGQIIVLTDTIKRLAPAVILAAKAFLAFKVYTSVFSPIVDKFRELGVVAEKFMAVGASGKAGGKWAAMTELQTQFFETTKTIEETEAVAQNAKFVGPGAAEATAELKTLGTEIDIVREKIAVPTTPASLESIAPTAKEASTELKVLSTTEAELQERLQEVTAVINENQDMRERQLEKEAQLNTTLANQNTELDSLKANLTSLNAEREEATGILEQENVKYEQIYEAIVRYEASLDNLKAKRASADASVEAGQAKLAELRESYALLADASTAAAETEVRGFKTWTQACHETKAAIAELEPQVEASIKQAEGYAGATKNLEAKIAELSTTFEAQAGSVEVANDAYKRLGVSIKTVGADIEELDYDMQVTKSTMESVGRSVISLQEVEGELATEQKTLITEMNELSGANERATLSEKELAAAQAEQEAATVAGKGALAEMGGALYSLIGGPIGVAIISFLALGAGINAVVGYMEAHSAEAQEARKEQKLLNDVMADASDKSAAAAQGADDYASNLKTVVERLEKAKKAQEDYNTAQENSETVAANNKTIDEAQPKIQKAAKVKNSWAISKEDAKELGKAATDLQTANDDTSKAVIRNQNILAQNNAKIKELRKVAKTQDSKNRADTQEKIKNLVADNETLADKTSQGQGEALQSLKDYQKKYKAIQDSNKHAQDLYNAGEIDKSQLKDFTIPVPKMDDTQIAQNVTMLKGAKKTYAAENAQILQSEKDAQARLKDAKKNGTKEDVATAKDNLASVKENNQAAYQARVDDIQRNVDAINNSGLPAAQKDEMLKTITAGAGVAAKGAGPMKDAVKGVMAQAIMGISDPAQRQKALDAYDKLFSTKGVDTSGAKKDANAKGAAVGKEAGKGAKKHETEIQKSVQKNVDGAGNVKPVKVPGSKVDFSPVNTKTEKAKKPIKTNTQNAVDSAKGVDSVTVPGSKINTDPITTKLMKFGAWALKQVSKINKILAGLGGLGASGATGANNSGQPVPHAPHIPIVEGEDNGYNQLASQAIARGVSSSGILPKSSNVVAGKGLNMSIQLSATVNHVVSVEKAKAENEARSDQPLQVQAYTYLDGTKVSRELAPKTYQTQQDQQSRVDRSQGLGPTY